jgi:hypothetical protein
MIDSLFGSVASAANDTIKRLADESTHDGRFEYAEFQTRLNDLIHTLQKATNRSHV